jgi:hypothetical protein
MAGHAVGLRLRAAHHKRRSELCGLTSQTSNWGSFPAGQACTPAAETRHLANNATARYGTTSRYTECPRSGSSTDKRVVSNCTKSKASYGRGRHPLQQAPLSVRGARRPVAHLRWPCTPGASGCAPGSAAAAARTRAPCAPPRGRTSCPPAPPARRGGRVSARSMLAAAPWAAARVALGGARKQTAEGAGQACTARVDIHEGHAGTKCRHAATYQSGRTAQDTLPACAWC